MDGWMDDDEQKRGGVIFRLRERRGFCTRFVLFLKKIDTERGRKEK